MTNLSVTNAAVPKAVPAGMSTREQLIATVEALIYDDVADLDLFQPGTPWPQARNIAQTSHAVFQAPFSDKEGTIKSDYEHAPAVDYAMSDTAEYSQIYAESFNDIDPHPLDVTARSNSWYSQVSENNFESSATNGTPYSAPPPPTPPHLRGHHSSANSTKAPHYGQTNTANHGDLTHYDFSEPLTSSIPEQPPEVVNQAFSESSNLPFLDFMSWDMCMSYGTSPSSATNDTINNDSANSSDDLCDERRPSVLPSLNEKGPAVQPPPKASSQAPSKLRQHRRRPGSANASPSPSPCSRPSQAPEKAPCQPRGHRAHSAIEKRYRAGINEKFEALRSCIESRKRPKHESLGQALRPEVKESEGSGGTTTTPGRKKGASGDSDAASRMNKADVLSETVEYVQQLEEENRVMLDQLKVLIQRLRATRMALQPCYPEIEGYLSCMATKL